VTTILNIDTAVEAASVCLAVDGRSVSMKSNGIQKDQASWIHIAIDDLLKECERTLKDLDAVAISAGPGSYTGLRVGMATAKGLCFALRIPLIAINTLKMMAQAVPLQPETLLCPMIDARRMEVFAAVFDAHYNEVLKSTNMILDEKSFDQLLDSHHIIFFGNGSVKFRPLIAHPNAFFQEISASALHMANLSYSSFLKREFSDLAYSEPFYGKEFHSSVK
jgi:tRNA threonylcarbamoyladenosine biosynthesis protein TsaB